MEKEVNQWATPGLLDDMQKHSLKDTSKELKGDPKLITEKIELLTM